MQQRSSAGGAIERGPRGGAYTRTKGGGKHYLPDMRQWAGKRAEPDLRPRVKQELRADLVAHPEKVAAVEHDIVAKAKEGGFSQRLDGTTPKDGYMISRHPKEGLGIIVDVDDPKVEEKLTSWLLKAIPEVLTQRNTYLGGWLDGGKLYFDVSDNVTGVREHQAKELGLRNRQIGVWDVKNFQTIQSGGTGTWDERDQERDVRAAHFRR